MFPSKLQHILVPIDFSEHSDHALEAAITLALPSGARLALLNVYLPPYAMGEVNFGVADFVSVMERDAREQLALRAARAEKQGLSCEAHALLGTPHIEILRFIDQHDPDLVVMSTHGRTGLKHVVLGSVAERVVQRSRCPVLVLPARQGLAPLAGGCRRAVCGPCSRLWVALASAGLSLQGLRGPASTLARTSAQPRGTRRAGAGGQPGGVLV